MGTGLILGIHGLNRKPAKPVLANWWLQSLEEGLARAGLATGSELPFELVYWADLLHPEPFTAGADPAPYVPAPGSGPLPTGKSGFRRKMAALGMEAAGKLAEQIASAPGIDGMLNDMVQAKAPDLFRYQTEPALRASIRARLADLLIAASTAHASITLIAHSMGSIIAYDVLRANPALSVVHLITIGSPLGLGDIKRHCRLEFGAPAVPDNVGRWTNLADPRDPITALDVRLRSDYRANRSGVRITDMPVFNGYLSPLHKANPHKVYGYLRTPEMARLISETRL